MELEGTPAGSPASFEIRRGTAGGHPMVRWERREFPGSIAGPGRALDLGGGQQLPGIRQEVCRWRMGRRGPAGSGSEAAGETAGRPGG